MGKGNKKEVTSGNFPLFPHISKTLIYAMVFLTVCWNWVTDTCSQRNKLLSRKEDGLFPETAYNGIYAKL
jgi:hypothetical protein